MEAIGVIQKEENFAKDNFCSATQETVYFKGDYRKSKNVELRYRYGRVLVTERVIISTAVLSKSCTDISSLCFYSSWLFLRCE